MQENWTFDITERVEDSIDVVTSIIAEKQHEMGIFLSYYYRKEGAVVENVVMNSEPIEDDEYNGKVMVNFDLIHYNACLNIHENKKHYLELEYEIDPATYTISFKGPYWPERGQDEI
ncbi:MAG TPA: hypothetical protein VK921_13650 [Anditalea sp.]|nr:hypothetical protein [Anditalea sp.]